MDTQVNREVAAFFQQYPIRHLEQDQLFIHAGSEPEGIFYLVSGQVRQYDIDTQGQEIVVNVFKPAAFFPMSWAINHTPNRYFYAAAVPSDVRVAPATDAVAFLRTHGDITFDLLSRVYSGVEGMQRRMAHLMGGNAYSRVVFELIIESKRFGTRRADGAYRLPLHEDELARRAGLTRETVSRELAKLKQAGLIRISHREMIITDLSRLDAEIGENL